MPSLFRFIFVVGLIVGIAYGSLYILDRYFEPVAKETTQIVPGVRIRH